MKIEYITGNLLETPHLIILHGCNARGKMGSGVAKAVRAKYPLAYKEYHEFCLANKPKDIIGEVVWVGCNNKIIANGITQSSYGYDKSQYVDYDAINKVMKTVHEEACAADIKYVAMPLIGAGLGGGSWNMISSIIGDNFMNVTPVVYTLDGIIPSN